METMEEQHAVSEMWNQTVQCRMLRRLASQMYKRAGSSYTHTQRLLTHSEVMDTLTGARHTHKEGVVDTLIGC